ncbi:MAG: shikimate dehydrogenase [Cytophagaceae bacterium]|nr:shikimate dehydrogenase [Cytophagaceae bacterium]MDW8455856.1 shikimate dehydrogenase [Cytophagaceae bacterium]
MNVYGLIGYPLTHSFSKKYFTEKFERENIKNSRYELFEIREVSEVKKLVDSVKDLRGLNVTIPHKQTVMPLLDEIDAAASRIGAVNVIKISEGKLKGYNSDYYGFRESLKKFIQNSSGLRALVLGTGGAAKAVSAALDDMNISYLYVSRQKSQNALTYQDLDEKIIQQHQLIINTTPSGMYPSVNECPDIPYSLITPAHYLYDLVYNPEETLFMLNGKKQGAQVKNGLEMLYLQAEKAWEIWNQKL